MYTAHVQTCHSNQTEVCGDLSNVKRMKLCYYGYQTRKGGIAQVLIEGGLEGDRGRGRTKRQREDDLKEWSGGWTMEKLRRAAKERQLGASTALTATTKGEELNLPKPYKK